MQLSRFKDQGIQHHLNEFNYEINVIRKSKKDKLTLYYIYITFV